LFNAKDAENDHWAEEIHNIRQDKKWQSEMEGDRDAFETVSGVKNSRIPEAWIISYKNKFKNYWDFGVVALAIWNSLMIPLD